MFTNTNVRFSNTTQVARTVKFLRDNKTTKNIQYPPSFKIKVLDLMVEEMQKAENGDKTFVSVYRGNWCNKFSKKQFFEACGIPQHTPVTGKWEDLYNTLDGDASLNPNVVSISRLRLGDRYRSAESQGLGEIAQESGALNRKKMETKLKHGAKELGYKLIKVA